MVTNKEKFDSLVKAASKIVITAHFGSDDDAVCSTIGAYTYLNQKYPDKTIRVVIENAAIPEWSFLRNFDKIKWVKDFSSSLSGADLVIFLDGGNRGRFTTKPENLDITKFKSICVDHHPETFDGVTLNLSDPTGSATCQLLAEIFDVTSFDKQLAETLMIGILGDTGSFRFVDPTRSRVLETARKLVDVGKINIQVLQQRFERVPEAIFEIMKILMANTKNVVLPNLPGFSYTCLSKDLLAKYDSDTLSLAYHKYQFLFIRQIDGYPWGFVVAPKDEKEFKISFRSTPGAPNVKDLCNRFFDGGGHVMASGGKYVLKDGDITTDAPQICDFIINTLKANEIPLNSAE